MLVSVNLAEEGILRLIFAAVYLMFRKVANDNEVSAASRKVWGRIKGMVFEGCVGWLWVAIWKAIRNGVE
ncbi:hypothetical protein CK203_001942 [Vitis vinifera]|uniref:Uncharacterized protein n=1 Tax=Vitis vinifera TaxID=29760 RepID=A0A438KK79_VITVI|nr:hypothetical protein CK203_001942 [Vitis vinifera]